MKVEDTSLTALWWKKKGTTTPIRYPNKERASSSMLGSLLSSQQKTEATHARGGDSGNMDRETNLEKIHAAAHDTDLIKEARELAALIKKRQREEECAAKEGNHKVIRKKIVKTFPDATDEMEHDMQLAIALSMQTAPGATSVPGTHQYQQRNGTESSSESP